MNTNNLKRVLDRGWMIRAVVVLLLLLTTGLIFATVQTNCIFFRGTNQSYVDLNKNLVPGDFTLEVWLYPQRAVTDPNLLAVLGGKLGWNNQYFGYDFVYGLDQTIVFRNSTSTGIISTTSNASVPLNQWTHVAITWGTGGTSPNGIYINGVFDQAINVINDLPTAPGPMYLGKDYSALSWYRGRMDEFRYWTCKREQADIAANMNLSIRTPQPNLLISLPFTEGSGYNSRNYAFPMNPGHFVMLGDSIDWEGSPTAPTVTTQAATLVSETTATLNGTLGNVGSDYPWLGFVWNTTGNPTYSSPMVDPYHYWGPESTTGPFSYNLTGLTAGQTYFVRAFGVNNGGWAYGNQISFTTTSSGYNVNISTGDISGVRIYSNLANYGIDPAMPIVLAAGYTGTFNAEKEHYVFNLATGSDSNVINNLASDRNITFTGTFIYDDLAGFTYTADPNIPLVAEPGSLATLTVPLPQNPSPSANVMNFTGSTTTDLKIDLPAGSWYVLAYYDDPADGGLGWHKSSSYPQNGPGFVTYANLPFGTNNEIPVMISTQDATLPVELSSFTAVLTAELNVNLTWVTQSETDVMGYNVFRAENGSFACAQRINPAVIQAANTSQQQVYTYIDAEVDVNCTYYYWLENVEMNGNNGLYGPQSVSVTGNTAPVIPEVSLLENVYPNPMRAGQINNINVSLKDGDSGTVTVYNLRGQIVKVFEVNQGNHNLTWNGQNCGSGIYLVKMSTNTVNTAKRLVIIK